MRRMQLCPTLSPDPLSSSMYTEQSSHSVRVGEEASVCGMISCVCVPLCGPTCWVMLAGISVLERLPPPTAEIKHFRSQLQGDMASSSSLTSALPLFSRKARWSLISSMACSTLRYHDNPPPVKGGREREGEERTHWWMRDMKAQPMNTIGHLSPSLLVCTCCCHGDGPSV